MLFIAGGLVLGVFSYRHGMRREHPLLDYSTLKVSTFNVTVVAGSFTRIVFARKGDTLHADFGALGGLALQFV